MKFHEGLREHGFEEGRNLSVQYRWADSAGERLYAMAAELVANRVALIAVNGMISAIAARKATATIPIVFMVGTDPAQAGLVASLNRPGGNLTGINLVTNEIGEKRFELLHALVPKARSFGVIVWSGSTNAAILTDQAKMAGRALGLQVHPLSVGSDKEVETALVRAKDMGIDAMLVQFNPFFTSRRDRLVALAARYRIPALYGGRDYAEAGGLMSYGSNLADGYRHIGYYAGRILKGEPPGELPVVQPTKFELVINLKAAKALGLAVPERLLALADEVVE
jgi:putative ABC transport system substrate-binding protein